MSALDTQQLLLKAFGQLDAPNAVAVMSNLLRKLGDLGTEITTVLDDNSSLTTDLATANEDLATANDIITDLESQIAALEATPVITKTGTGVFGTIATATTNEISFKNNQQYLTGGYAVYTGDSDAFVITELNYMTVNIPLNTGTQFPLLIGTQDIVANTYFKVQATAQNSGVAKTGSLVIADQFNDQFPPVPTRTLLTVTLSKTYVP